MIKPFFTIATFLIFINTFAQRGNDLPKISGIKIVTDSDYIKLKASISKTTGFHIDKHPLAWAKEQEESNLLKTDTCLTR